MSETKWAVRSTTILGVILTALVGLLPAFGISFSADDAALISQGWDAIIQAVTMLIAVIGRFKANTSVTLLPKVN